MNISNFRDGEVFILRLRKQSPGVFMDTVLYLASLATRPSLAATKRIWSILQHFLAGLMVLLSFLVLLHALCGS
ncbi:hypothetical protein CKA34_24090 (plasmid) [Rhizobium sp. 11515TR]|nr:hypothetical protein CKA34_24090 [Rhizobium sp. 11515TR]